MTLTTKTKKSLLRDGRPLEPDLDAAFERVMRLMRIPGKSGEEAEVARFVVDELRRAGAPAAAIQFDDAHHQSPLKGNVGNLVLALSGTQRGPRRLLMAHLDTVPLCVGCRPTRKKDVVVSDDPSTGLGADNRAGCAVILTAALEILKRRLPHPPLTFLWAVQEEVGLHGSHYARLSKLGKPRLAFNWDGGSAEKLTIGATGAYRMTIEVQGLASHAGGAPEKGVSSITIAGLAIADLEKHGWLGDVRKRGRHGTSNIGVIEGGAATNVVADRVRLRAECRSHDAAFRKEILDAFQTAFERAAGQVRNVAGVTGRACFQSQLDYDAFRLDDEEPCVLAAEAAVRAVDAEPMLAITNGGLDANWLTARGIPTVTLGCGQQNVHTTSEQLDVPAFERACRIALRLATATE
ncbi:MAG TPA: M20/M25/M40 family metallo-hydrolase [Pirellulales bacterium]|nr:M20/M25/M40 family metallo-hydrolase [Pirellulales bacterium]